MNTFRAIQSCHEHGLPYDLLIPIEPRGKKPAYNNGNCMWYDLPGWRQGVRPDLVKTSDAAGGNAGLILGEPHVDANARYLAIDGDLLDGDVLEHSKWFRQQFLNNWPYLLPVRNTVEPRFAALVGVLLDADPGCKSICHLLYDGKDIGKLEVLTMGQQIVIAGTHHSGNPITWQWHTEDTVYPAPPRENPDEVDVYEGAVAEVVEIEVA